MLEPKDKAKRMIMDYLKIIDVYDVISLRRAKQCVINCIEEIFDVCPLDEKNCREQPKQSWVHDASYWEEVKKETENY